MLTAETIRREGDGTEAVVSATIRSNVNLPERLWFSLPPEFEGVPVEMPEVSAELLDGCRRIAEIFDEWSTALGDELRLVPITAPTRPRDRVGRAAGAFFSGGVDSTYTLLRNHDRYPAGDPRRIRYLLLGHGLDVSLDDQALFDRVLATVRDFANAHGVEAIPIRTNVGAFTAGIDWGRYAHGPCLAAAVRRGAVLRGRVA